MPHRMPHGKDRVAIALGWKHWQISCDRISGETRGLLMPGPGVPTLQFFGLESMALFGETSPGKSETLSARTSLNSAVAG